MPAPVLKSLAEKHGVSLKKVEEYWEFGKKQAEEQGLQGDAVYKYAMAIVKRRLGEKSN